MAGFHDALAGMRGEDGSLTIGDDFDSILTGAYDGDMDLSNAKIADLEAQLTKLQAELVATKAANWDLLQTTPVEGDGSADGEGDPDSDPDNSENDGDVEPDIDDFFGEDK